MKNYAIYLQGREKSTIIKGAIMVHCETTGQIIIYKEKQIEATNIVAIVPANALIFELP